MTQRTSLLKNHFEQLPKQVNGLSISLFSVAYCLLIDWVATAVTQIFPDNTLPNNSVALANGNIIKITGSITAGSNLFHSCEQFFLFTRNTAWVNNAVAIENIISRVTGGFIANIDDLISVHDTANLLLINTNSILFRQNETLDISGSFIDNIADSFKTNIFSLHIFENCYKSLSPHPKSIERRGVSIYH